MSFGGAFGGAASGALAGSGFGWPGALAGGLVGGTTGFFEGKSKKKLSRKEKNKQRRYEKDFKKLAKQQEKSQRKYNRNYYEGPHGEKAFNKRVDDFYKKYGDEKVTQYDVLDKGQKKLLDRVTKGGARNIDKYGDLNKLSDIGRDRGYQRGQSTLQDLMRDPGISDIERNKYYRQGGRTVQDLMENPGITDIQGMRGYQQGQRGLDELLDQSPEAYNRYAEPLMKQFQQQTIPALLGRFGGGGKNSSALNNALGTASTNLYSQLGAYKAQLMPEALRQQLQYSQAPLESERSRANILGASAGQGLEFAAAPWKGQELEANIRGRAADSALPYASERSRMNLAGYGQAMDQSRLGLGTQSFGTQYRGPVSPTDYIVTGGRQPTSKFLGLPPQTTPNRPPSGAQQFGSQVLSGLGKAAGENAYGNLSSLFDRGIAPKSTSWGSNQLGGP